ncbi:uncharacterized protein LOC141640787 [Silene latifolia]|uniref:uncharacterized protein LOC141640787 n=1 Tax=Silene latifolia TaxID=37657 RepID=UPI003D76B8AF
MPNELRMLFMSNDAASQNFRKYVLLYNSSFSFTSFGVKKDYRELWHRLHIADEIDRTVLLAGTSESEKKVSSREYYCYRLQIRPNDSSILLKSGRLLQQYMVYMYIKIETTRLDYIRNNQNIIRADLYQGIIDSYNAGQTQIERELLLFEEAQNRPDLVSRIVRVKLLELKKDICIRKIFGNVAGYIYVVEFQKRGLAHAHFLIILDSVNKIGTPYQYDEYVCAELPDSAENPTNPCMVHAVETTLLTPA